MIKPLTIALSAAALLAAGGMALADNSPTYYAATNPRIIQVPQRGDDLRESHASVRRVVPNNIDDEDVVPARPHRVTKPAPRLPLKQQVTVKEPARRKPFNAAKPEPEPLPEPEPAGPRRALLSAPPPPPTSSVHDGPTPLRPTPRFGQPMPRPPEPLTTFTPPAPQPVAPVVSNPPADEPAPTIAAHADTDDSDDHLPPPGDPRLTPPEPKH